MIPLTFFVIYIIIRAKFRGVIVDNIRNFVVSDLHGQGQIYNSIMNTLEKEQVNNPDEKIVLYINGDIIDRGPDSLDLLLDVMDRVNGRKGNIEVKMLAGNHELIMLEAIREKVNGEWCNSSTWFVGANGGQESSKKFDKLPVEKQQEVVEFLESLPLNQVFDKSILGDQGVVIAHASAIDTKGTKNVRDIIDNRKLSNVLWVRKDIEYYFAPVGRANYLSIIGHTPTDSGYIEYEQEDNVLYVDCGCAKLARNPNRKILVPVVELNYKKNCLDVLHFDKDGSLVYTGMIKRKSDGSLDYRVEPYGNFLLKIKNRIGCIDNIKFAFNKKSSGKKQVIAEFGINSDIFNTPKVKKRELAVRITEEDDDTVVWDKKTKPYPGVRITDEDDDTVVWNKKAKSYPGVRITDEDDDVLKKVETSEEKNNNKKIVSTIISEDNSSFNSFSKGIIVPKSTIYLPSSQDIIDVLAVNNGTDIISMYSNFVNGGRSNGIDSLYINTKSGLIIPRTDGSKYIVSGKNPADNMLSNIMLSGGNYKAIMSCVSAAKETLLKQYGYTIKRN